MIGRPRSVEDDAVLDAVERVIGREGPTGVTVAAIGREVGLSAPALTQRFGSRHGLLVAFAARGADAADRSFDRAERRGIGGVAAAQRGLLGMVPAGVDRAWVANHLAVLQLDLVDHELRVHAVAHAHAVRRRLTACLDRAKEAGELAGSTNVADVVRTVEIVYHGAMVRWAIDGTGSLRSWVRDCLEAAVRPYLSRTR